MTWFGRHIFSNLKQYFHSVLMYFMFMCASACVCCVHTENTFQHDAQHAHTCKLVVLKWPIICLGYHKNYSLTSLWDLLGSQRLRSMHTILVLKKLGLWHKPCSPPKKINKQANKKQKPVTASNPHSQYHIECSTLKLYPECWALCFSSSEREIVCPP